MPGSSYRRYGPPRTPASLSLAPAALLEQWYNDIGLSEPSHGQEPPRKRARLDDIQDPVIANPIPVARISVALRSDSSPNVFEKGNDQEHFEEMKEVGLLSVEQPEGQCATFTLSSSRLRHRYESHYLATSSAIPTEQELEDIQRVAEIERRSRGTGKSHVAQSRCSLRCARNTKTGALEFFLEATILWPDGASALTVNQSSSRLETWIFARYYGIEFPSQASTWDTKVFYDSVHAPATDEPILPVVDRKVLETELYPFQKRAVGWMLRREKAPVTLDSSKQSSPIRPKVEQDAEYDADAALPFSYMMARDADGRECLVSKSQSTIARKVTTQHLVEPKGGILAEEMGLGKTVELISLICMNRRSMDAKHPELKATGATLIVTPPTILQQWIDELSRHAPSLSWMHYQGITSQNKTKATEKELMEIFATRDVIITTYPVLAKEIHFAVDPPDRNLRRREAPPARKRSPLVQMHWWRVCLDEAQMVESGVSAAAKVVALIPRENAWAVSGTPLKNDVQDLRGLLVFLRYRPYSENNEFWKRLVYYHRDEFERLFNSITLRHTKDKIRHELRLPPQRRITITVPFTAVEEQNYKSLFAEMAYDCGCALDGSPLHDQWNPEDPRIAERMRSWLLRLRQSCLHPQIGGRNRQALGRGGGPLRTVGEVLEVMIDQTETAIRVDSRQSLLARILRAHIIGNAKDDERRAEKALDILQQALLLADARVEDSRRELAQSAVLSDDADASTDDSPEVVARQRLQANLRGALELQHACDFYVGTAYYQIKTNPNLTKEESEEFKRLEEKEIMHYERARITRKEILRDSTAKVENLISALQERKVDSGLTSTASLSGMQGYGGIESRRVLTKAEKLADIISAQTDLLMEWRTKIVDLLCKPLVDKEDEATGEEYEDSTKQQDEMYCYIDTFRAMIADRSTCLSGQINILINHEMGMLYKEAKDEKGHSPVLMIELLEKRNALVQREDGMISLRGLLHEARSAETAVQWRGANSAHVEAELVLIRKLIATLQAVLSAQTKGLSHLEKDQELFRAAMNQRLEFYRQLQQISDSVVPYKDELDETLDVAALTEATNKLNALENSLSTSRTKLKFLMHLREESTDEAQKICVICQCPFEQGMLTVCGHQYCKDCIQHWWQQHRTCPVCKRNLRKTDFHAVSYKPRELQAQQEEIRSEASSAEDGFGSAGEQSATDEKHNPTGRISIYNDISPAVLNEIKSIDLPHRSSYGTKIDTISRHLIYLRSSEPGVKTVIFSQYRDFLSVLSSAFKAMGISHVQIQQATSITRFREDASIEAFLLDAKTDSSGLNLVNATHVMLCEPLINAAIELQAIARVHRIGQRRPTSVWMYLVKDTVEESIYELSVKRRLEHVQASSSARSKREANTATTSRSVTPAPGMGTEAAVEAANSLELQQAPLGKLLVHGKGQGEVVNRDDLWTCLFGQASKSAASNSVDRGFLDTQADDYAANGSGAAGAEVGRFLRAEAAENRVGS